MRIRALAAFPLMAALAVAVPTAASAESCIDTGAGLTANHVNEIPDDPVTVTCDVGVYLDEDATVDGLELTASTDEAPSVRFGVLVSGADVRIANATVTSPDDYPRQFVGIAYEGATGAVSDSTVTGGHRAGIVVRNPGADVDVRRNEVIGSGPRSSGWAQNGIQVSNAGTGTIADNEVADHWWSLNNFVSSGIIVVGADDVVAHHNVVRDNDLGVALFGNGNKFLQGEVTVTETVFIDDGTRTEHYGVLVQGDGNNVNQNLITAQDGDAGIYVYPGSNRTKLIRNDISGWDTSVVDGGDDTKLPAPFSG